MTRINDSQNPPLSLYNSACEGFVKGSVIGVKLGGTLLGMTFTYGAIHCGLENAYRAIGNEPSWPLSLDECNLDQFRDLSMCTEEPLFDSSSSFLATLIAAPTVVCAVVGVVNSVARNIMGKLHSE